MKYSQNLCLTFGTWLSSTLNWELSLCNEGEKAKSVMGVLEAKWNTLWNSTQGRGDCPFCWVVIWNNFWEMKMLPTTWYAQKRLSNQHRGFRSVSLKVSKYRELPPTLKDCHFPLWHPEVQKFESGNKPTGQSYKISNFNQNMSDRILGLADIIEI